MNRLARPLRRLLVAAGVGALAYGFTLPTSGSQGRWLACLTLGAVSIAIGCWPRIEDDDESTDERPAVNVFAAIALLFGVVAVQLARMQAVFNGSIAARSGVDPATGDVFSNPRRINVDLVTDRGSILDRNGALLADSTRRRGVYYRTYPVPTSSYVAGYFSPLKYGKTGLEASWNAQLTGRDIGNPMTERVDRLLGRRPPGADLHLTLDAGLQAEAHRLMEDRLGAAVLIEAATGAVRVLASNPYLDPGRLVAVDDATVQTATDYWERLQPDPDKPLLVRATNGLYTPGSTFKTITAATAIGEGLAEPDDVYTDAGELNVEGRVIVEENRPDDTVTEWTLAQGLAYSLNVVFAQIGLQVGPDRLRDYAERFGFGQEIPFDVPVATGQVASSPTFLENEPGLADTAFGQGELLSTPLGMALVAAAFANDGVIMRPYLVERVRRRQGGIDERRKPEPWRTAVDTETAATLRELMVNAVENGYSSAARVPGYVVGGKTGTAETGGEQPHAWFIGFIGDPEPRFAVAVVLEFGGLGVQGPLTIARDLLSAAISSPR